MKNYELLFSLLLILGCASINAQINFGFKAGINLANWSTEGSNSTTSIHAGALARFMLTEKFSVQPELLYSGKGTDLGNYIPNNPMRFTLKYVSLPILVGYQVGQVNIKAGVEISNLVNSEIEVNSQKQEIPDAFDDWDYGLAVGASLHIVSGLSLEVRYLHGLKDVVELYFTDINGQSLGKLDEGKNRVLQFGLQYLFE